MSIRWLFRVRGSPLPLKRAPFPLIYPSAPDSGDVSLFFSFLCNRELPVLEQRRDDLASVLLIPNPGGGVLAPEKAVAMPDAADSLGEAVGSACVLEERTSRDP